MTTVMLGFVSVRGFSSLMMYNILHSVLPPTSSIILEYMFIRLVNLSISLQYILFRESLQWQYVCFLNFEYIFLILFFLQGTYMILGYVFP
jgi:hypothetical protein